MEKTNQPKLCKKLMYGDPQSPNRVLGIIVSESETFMIFRTAKRTIKIRKDTIHSLEDTNREFKESA